MLIDTSPIVAVLDAADANHQRCVATLQKLRANTLVTTWPSVTEAMYLLAKAGGHAAQERLWNLIEAGTVRLFEPTEADQPRMRELMTRYKDSPMDFADASL